MARGGEGLRRRETPQDTVCLNPEPSWRPRAAAAPKQGHTHRALPTSWTLQLLNRGLGGKEKDTHTPLCAFISAVLRVFFKDPREPQDPCRGSTRPYFDPHLHEWRKS